MCCMVLAPLVASLMPGICPSPKGSLLELAAVLAAVALAPVVRPADVERLATVAAIQLEDHELVHPARKDENWTTTSATRNSTHVLAVHPPAVHEGPGANLDPPSFLRLRHLQQRAEIRHFWAPSVLGLTG